MQTNSIPVGFQSSIEKGTKYTHATDHNVESFHLYCARGLLQSWSVCVKPCAVHGLNR